MTDNTADALDQGIAAANGPEKSKEYADVKAWLERYDAARKFDEEARKQYAKDRRYARGDSGAIVDANIIGTFIDILESFYYARDPDIDVLPAKSAEPPSIDAVRDAAAGVVENDPQVKQAAMIAYQATLAETGDQATAQQAAEAAMVAVSDTLIQAQFDAMQEQYQKRQRDNKAYAETIELIVSRLWKDSGLKARGRKMTRSNLTTGVGIIKAFWDERTAQTPETAKQIADLQDNIKRAAAERADMEDRDPGLFARIADGIKSVVGADLESKLASYERQLAAIRAQAERVIARGFVVDSVRSEDLQVAPGVDLCDYLDAPWIVHRIPMPFADAQAKLALSPETMKDAVRYSARKPVMRQNESAMVQAESFDVTDADAYVSSMQAGDTGTAAGEFVMLLEIWDRTSNTVLTAIEGLKCWAKPAFSPKATTRFYPFFLLTGPEVDGQRHPQSLVSRSMKLADEYNRIGDALRTHRMRIKPKMMFLKGTIGHDAMTKVNDGEVGEYVGVETTIPNADLRMMFVPVQYPMIDMAVYDRSPIVAELERLWGVQEALSGGINVAKTATEAEIQQTGFQARTGGRRDALESVLQDLAQYTAEVARANLDDEDVRVMVGPDAMWPEYKGAVDLNSLVTVEIRAGSSGKPNTNADRQAWSQQLALFSASVDKIGMLRNSLPEDIADAHETLLRITAERSGDRLDIDQLVPQPGPAPMAVPPGAPTDATGAPTPPAAQPAPPIAA